MIGLVAMHEFLKFSGFPYALSANASEYPVNLLFEPAKKNTRRVTGAF